MKVCLVLCGFFSFGLDKIRYWNVHKIRMSVNFVEVCAVKSILSLEACLNFYPDFDLPYGPADACCMFLYVGHPIHEASRTHTHTHIYI